MNLYRLDYLRDDGSVYGPVRDLLGDYLSRSWAAARARAIQECPAGLNLTTGVAITRISAGGMRRMAEVRNGKVARV